MWKTCGMWLVKRSSVCALSPSLGRTTKIVEHEHEAGDGSMCVTNVKILLSTKEQAVKAGTAVSTSRQ